MCMTISVIQEFPVLWDVLSSNVLFHCRLDTKIFFFMHRWGQRGKGRKFNLVQSHYTQRLSRHWRDLRNYLVHHLMLKMKKVNTRVKRLSRASLVAQWLRICLPMQGTRVQALVWEDPTCRGATRPVSHNYWDCASGACAPQQERPR